MQAEECGGSGVDFGRQSVGTRANERNIVGIMGKNSKFCVEEARSHIERNLSVDSAVVCNGVRYVVGS